MDDLEVFFCDLCSTSVPATDLASKEASKVGDKVVGACCLASLPARGDAGTTAAKQSAKSAEATSGGGGWFLAAFLMLLAVAGATLFLDWRFGNELEPLRSSMVSIQDEVDPLAARLVGVEKRLGNLLGPASIEPLRHGLDTMRDDLVGLESRVIESVRENAQRLRDLDTRLGALDAGQRDLLSRLSEVHGDLRRTYEQLQVVSERLMMASLSPVAAAGVGSHGGSPSGLPASQPPSPLSATELLPPHLLRFIEQLDDADDGERFVAVDELLESGDPRVFEFILPLAQDPDHFVRRLVCEGLKDHRSDASVDALLEALSDSESLVRHTAHASLRELTAQELPFDPDATPKRRASMERKWRDWWGKNRDSMF